MKYKIHPLAEALPTMSEPEYQEFLADIKAKKLLEPITLYEGKVLDGRHSLRACEEADIEPRFEEYTGDDPLGYVLAKNFKRRHLTPSQKAMALFNLNEIVSQLRKQGQQRKRKNLKKGKRSPIPSRDGIGDETGANPETANENTPPDTELAPWGNKHATSTSAQLGALADVSEKTMERAKYIRDYGTSEDVKEVESGEKTVNQKAKEIRARQKNNATSGTRKASRERKGNPAKTDEDLIYREWNTCIQTLDETLLLDASTLPPGETKDRVARFQRAVHSPNLRRQDMAAMIKAVDGLLKRDREVRRQLIAKKKEADRATHFRARDVVDHFGVF